MERIIDWLMVLAMASAATPLGSAETGNAAVTSGPVEGKVERVATLDFITTETVILLGATPVAVADLQQYRAWIDVGNEALDSACRLGRRSNPNHRALASADPDLIAGAAFRHQPLTGELSRIAPVVLFEWLPDEASVTAVEQLRRIVRHLGSRLDASQRAEALINAMDRTLAAQAKRIEEAGLADTPVVLAQHVHGTNQFTLYTKQSLGASLIRRLGLRNAHTGAGRRFGYQTVTLRGLNALGDAQLLLAADPDDPAFEEIRQSAIWQSLPAVRAGRVHRLPPKTWFFGGQESIRRRAREFTDALLTD